MNKQLRHLAYEIELQPREKLMLPPCLLESVGAGRWVITVQPADEAQASVRNHGAFLNGYAEEDEGLYEDASGR